MPRKLFAAISQIVLGALIAIAPQTFAHVCAVKDMPMACRYTARVALGLGVVIALLAIIGFSRQAGSGPDWISPMPCWACLSFWCRPCW